MAGDMSYNTGYHNEDNTDNEVEYMEEVRSFGYICPKCGKAVLGTRSVFALQVAAARIGCECGESELEIQTDGVKFRLWVPCGLCGGTHQAEVDVSAILTGRGVGLACPETKQLCCYAGEESQVMARTEELAIRVDKERSEQREAFTDNVIMYEVLSELKDMAGRGGVRCTCGSRDYGIRIHRDAVDLTCRACGGRLRLPAATDEDLDQLCCRMTLEIPGRKDGV